MTYRNPKLLKSAKDKECKSCGSFGTTVAAHSNALEDGHGIGHKAPDYMVAWLCQSCHDLVDGRAGKLTKQEKREMWERAWKKTVAHWFEYGFLTVN